MSQKRHSFCFCNNLVECQPISIFSTVTSEQISNNMRYVLPTAPNVCSYTTLAKMNCQIFTCLTTGTGFVSTKLLLFSIPTLHACVNAHGGQFGHLFRLYCLSYQVLLVFLTYMVAWFQVEHESRLRLSAVVPVSPPGGRRGQRCSSRGSIAQGPRPVAQNRRGRVVDEQSVNLNGAGGKTRPSNTRDVFTHGQL